MVNIVRHDLEFILRQIKIAEAHSGGTALDQIYVNAAGDVVAQGTPGAVLAISHPLAPYGLRTVDGSYNNMVAGRDQWGAADNPFAHLTDPSYRNDLDGDSIPLGQNGPLLTNTNYGSSGSVVDADPRLISNLIVDQTLDNPAAIYAALVYAGAPPASYKTATEAIHAAFEAAKTSYLAAHPGSTPVQVIEGASQAAAVTTLLAAHGLEMEGSTIVLPNVAPDEGLSAPFNSWFTLFGQFFDHGLDLVAKQGGTIYIPLSQDDPLYNPASPQTNFMVLTRTTPGADNLTTPFVDQNQTYSSTASKQLFMREYDFSTGVPLATGKLLSGESGLATWKDVKDQAKLLGFDLTDADVGNIPLFAMDEYGEFLRGPNGFPQIVMDLGDDDAFGGGDDVLVEGNPLLLVPTTGALRTGHAFIDDIAHNAVFKGLVDPDRNPGTPNSVMQQPDGDNVAGNSIIPNAAGVALTYDDELLDAHYVTGDGRGNENIGLSAVHHVFHSEHNHMVEQIKQRALEANDLAFLNEWLRVDATALPANPAAIAALQWDGERLFQAARFTTEMQYQHLVFEEFARKVQPDIDAFVFNPSTDINPAIFAEFAHVIYRFGHSMLREDVAQTYADGTTGDLALFDAFLNPLAFGGVQRDANGTPILGANGQQIVLDHDQAAGAIVRGMTSQVGNEIDEFVTHVLRNQLVGIPLDLAAINIARGRDTGIPSLNEARAQFKTIANGDSQLDPYTSWTDFALNLKNPASIVNFVAAYGTHQTITSATTSDAKRDAAMKLVFGDASLNEADRQDFLNGRGQYAAKLGGLNDVDLWVGGLAEKKMPFGGMLGSTFSFVFELQLENLQNGDRFYYLSRVQGLNFLNELENNSFAKMVLNNTDLGATGYALPGDIFSVPDHVIYMDARDQVKFAVPEAVHEDPFLQALSAFVERRDANGNLIEYQRNPDGTFVKDAAGNAVLAVGSLGIGQVARSVRVNTADHLLIQGTTGDDIIVAGGGDDSVWGREGNDRIEAGYGVDKIHGGAGDDIITNSGTDIGEVDMLHGEAGDDVIHAGSGLALVFGNEGKDVLITGPDGKEAFGGLGDDFILGGEGGDFLLGNEGSDWIEGGGGFDTTAGDNSELFFNSTIIGHDVMFAGTDENDFDAESGDDIMVQGESVMRSEGMLGFDWAIHKGNTQAADSDLLVPIFTTDQQDILRDRFDAVEALSGWDKDDRLWGDNRGDADAEAAPDGPPLAGAENTMVGHELDQAGIARITDLDKIVTTDLLRQVNYMADGSGDQKLAFVGGNILLGGKGSDTIEGRGGDDVIDGDAWLNVRISIKDTAGNQLATVDSLTQTLDLPTTHPFYGQWHGKALSELMVSGAIKPVQLNIVREILDYEDSATAGVDVDTAVFGSNIAEYDIVRGADGTVTVIHSRFDAGTSLTLVSDGSDTLRNIEKLRFADGTVDVALVLDQPFDRLNIVATNGDIGRFDAVFTGLVAGRPVTVQWQVLGANGTWRNVVGADGTVANAPGGPAGDRFTPSNPNVEIRAVATWTSTLPNIPPTQRTLSVETAFIGTAGDDDMPGSTASNVILGLDGDDDIEGDAGVDTIDGGDGNDRIDGGGGDDILIGNDGDDILIGRTGDNRLQGGAGDDELSGSHGNDTLDGDDGTDTAVVSGPVEAYTFERTGAVITVTDNLGVEGDGRDTLTEVELLQVGETDVYAIGAAGTAAVDIVVGTAAGETLAGGAGNDLVFAAGGNDTVTWRPGDGRDFVDGGAGNDIFRVLDGSLPVQQLGLAAARAQFPALSFRDDTQTVVVRGGIVIAELKNVEAVQVNIQATGAPIVVDPTPTNGLVSPTEGLSLSISTAGIADANGLGAFSFGWQVLAADGVTWNTIAGATGQSFTPGQAQVGAVLRARVSFTDGQGNPEEVFSAPTGVVGDNFTGTPLIGLNFNGTAGDDIANGANAALLSNDTMNGNGGNDIINGRAGNDQITQLSIDGRDRVDGGTGTDTYILNGVAAAETFSIYALTAGQNANLATTLGTTFAATTEIVITRTVGATTTVVAELDNIEEITVNTLNVSANDGGGPNQGPAGNDTVAVFGNFTSTSLNFSTITINGAVGDDTVNISALTSAHRIVFRSNGGNDTIVGTLRPQDVIEVPAGTGLANYVSTVNPNGTTTLSNGTHSITYLSSGTPVIREEADPPRGAFEITPRDLEGLERLVNGQLPFPDDDDAEGALGPREVSGHGNNEDNPSSGQADTPFIRLTDARYGAADAAIGNRGLNPIYDGLDPRAISNILGAQEAGLPHAGNDANIFFMAFGQYVDHGLDFLPKNSANGTIQIGAPGTGHPGQGNPADLTRGEVYATEGGVPQHLNKTSAYVDQNQAYGSHNLVTQFLREGDGNGGLTSHLLKGAPDPSNPTFSLLPTLREAILHHWENNTVFHDPSLPGGQIAFRDYYSNYPVSAGVTGDLVDATGGFDPQVYSKLAANFMGSGQALLLDSNPFISLLDHYVAGDGRTNENFALTSMHTIWARNHNFHAEQLEAAGFEGTEQELFDAAKIINEAEYQRVVFNEYADTLLGGLRSRDGGGGDHGHDGYNADADAGVSHEFAAAAFRFGHSLIGQTLTVMDANGQPKQVSLVDAFLNPTNAASAFPNPLPPGYVPQPGYAQYGVGAILQGVAGQPAEDVDFNIVDAVRNDLVRIQADLFSFNLARGRDVGLGTLNQIRNDLATSTNSYVREAVGFAGNMSAYQSWEDFQQRNGLSNAVIAQFKQAYPDLVLDTPAKLAAFVAANPDIQLVNGNTVKGIDRVDFWLGGLAEQHVNGGIVGQTFWVVLHEQFDRLQEADRFYYKDRLEAFDFYDAFIDGQEFSDIVARNTGLTDLAEHIFEVDDEDDAGNGGEDDDEDDEDDDDTPTNPGDDDEDEDDDDEDDEDDEDDDDEDDDEDDDDPSCGCDDDDEDEDDDGPGTPAPNPNPSTGGALRTGTAAADVLIGTANADNLIGLAGDDTLIGDAGADAISAGEGADFIDAGDGRDVVFAGAGDDQVFGGGGVDMLYGEAGNDRIFGGAGNDLIDAGAGNDTVVAGGGDDRIIAATGDGDDTYFGDEIDGGNGTDTLDLSAITANLTIDLGNGLGGRGSAASSQSGSDTLWSIENVATGSGSDVITSSDAVNVMEGGTGNDTFRFLSTVGADGDTILDFQPGDRLDLSAIDADASQAGNQSFTLANGGSFTTTAQLTVTYETRADGEYTIVKGNVDAATDAEFQINLKGSHNLTANSFIV